MKLTIPLAALLAVFFLGGCSALGKGPGAECDTCAVAEASPAPGGTAAAAAASGGQRVSQDPRANDTARIQPFAPHQPWSWEPGCQRSAGRGAHRRQRRRRDAGAPGPYDSGGSRKGRRDLASRLADARGHPRASKGRAGAPRSRADGGVPGRHRQHPADAAGPRHGGGRQRLALVSVLLPAGPARRPVGGLGDGRSSHPECHQRGRCGECGERTEHGRGGGDAERGRFLGEDPADVADCLGRCHVPDPAPCSGGEPGG